MYKSCISQKYGLDFCALLINKVTNAIVSFQDTMLSNLTYHLLLSSGNHNIIQNKKKTILISIGFYLVEFV